MSDWTWTYLLGSLYDYFYKFPEIAYIEWDYLVILKLLLDSTQLS